jgi:hypothetical protein
MTDSTAKTLGFILWFVVVMLGFSKKLRDNKRVIIILILTSLVSIYPIFLKIQGLPFSGHSRGSDFLFAPFIYMLTYGLLRWLYKRVYNREPTYYRAAWYDPEEHRKQNVFDVVVYVIPLLFSGISIIFLNEVWH